MLAGIGSIGRIGRPSMRRVLAGVSIPSSGLVADYDLTGGADVQSIANKAPGASGTDLQRGSTAGADANDPTPTATGWSFDGVNDYGEIQAAITLTKKTIIVLFNLAAGGGTYKLTTAGGDGWVGPTVRDGVLGSLDYYGGTAWRPTTYEISTGTWYVGAVRYDDKLVRVSCNGDTTDFADASNAPTQRISRIGFDIDSSYPFPGTIGRVLIYDRVLSDSEYAQAYEALKSWASGKGITLPN